MIPKNNPLLRIENRSLMQMLTKIKMPPPPIPCTARPTMSMPMLTLTPASSEPTQKTPTAVSNTGLRPQMSDILPQLGAAAAFASR